MKKFNNPLDPDDLKIKAAIRLWANDYLALTADYQLDILEHQCSDASCLHAETVLKVENTEGSRFFKIAKPLTFVRKIDIQNMKEITTTTPSFSPH
jgi:NurA-like 5'-3' nuclease